ncbi:MAG TPA: hypothetical protein VNO81_07000 [Candidatus Nitrosotenuis sp.]|jgi:hypothetical protein|nr:hypothetical protein [Candidatus Nitrosotenuis sp.]
MRQTYQPVLLAQGPSTRDRTQGVIDVASPATSLPQFPGNPSMPYFPGGYNPTDPTAPAGLINRVWEPVNNRLGAAFNPHAQQDAEMVRHLLDRARRDMPNAKYMAREQALNYLRQRYGNLGERRLNQLLDNLATQTSNTGLFGRERNWIYADDIQQFLTNRRY